MINLHRALNNGRLLRALTGLSRKALDELLPVFHDARQAQVQVRKRTPARGQADKSRLSSMSKKLFYILFYFKCYLTFDVVGFLFDFDWS
jgi:hypothetical protein